MQTKTVTLGGRDYEIAELPARKASGWRKQFAAAVGPILGLMEEARAGAELEITGDLLALIGQLANTLLQTPDLVADLLFAYSPALEEHRDAIEENCYDSELAEAFTVVIGLAYPFMRWAQMLEGLASGSTAKRSAPISMSSQSPNGVTPKAKLTQLDG